MTEEKKTFIKKLLSIKTWVTLWAMVIVSYVIFTNKTDFLIVAQWLCTVPLAYLGINVWQKKIMSDKEEKEKE
ncbi:MAG: hypothetical protein PUJ82_13900 [Spirochaetales bacterium]|nr:hypothetical protein [Spirochaetales bacterium]MDY5914624.1 hypothetical protein [Treponema sp.]